MMKHAIDWMQMGTTIVEAILLLRVLSLKLYRVYAFITLYCALNVLFDGASWFVGWDAPEAENIFIYSLYFFALLYPFVAWDAFEESRAQIRKLMRLQTVRMVSGLLLTGICAVVVGLYLQPTDAQGNSTIAVFMGVFLLIGAASAGAAFLWFVYRFARAEKITIPHNTFVWTIYFIAAFVLAILDCLEVMIRALISTMLGDIAAVVLLTLNLALLTWCIIFLRAVPSDVTSAPEKAST